MTNKSEQEFKFFIGMMMKKLLVMTVCLASVSIAAMANAKDYIRGDAGVALSDKIHGANYGRPDAAFVFDVGVGRVFTEKVRADITYVRFNDLKTPCSPSGCASQKFASNVFLVNGYYDAFKVWNIKHYLTAGVGAAFTQNNNLTLNRGGYKIGKDATTFAWTLGLGLNYPVSPQVAVDLHYNYYNLGTAVKTTGVNVLSSGALMPGTPVKGKFSTHVIGAGVQFFY